MGKFELLNQLVPIVLDTHRRDTDIEKENERDTTAREEEEEEADWFLDEKSQQSLTGKKRSVEKQSHGEEEEEEEEGRRILVAVPGLERPPSHMVCMHGRAKRESERCRNSTTIHKKER
jgi:hypothetical protein